ncbi:MAG TPA: hypothetical protein VGA04_07435 [Streptosporangiaceae bacterium]
MGKSDGSHAPTWDEIIAGVRSGAGSRERRDVGQWAVEQIRDALGEDWPQRWHARFGALPPFLERASSDAFGYAQLIETGLRLNSLAGTLRLRRLTREWSRHLEGIRLLHARLQLEVAALGLPTGAAVEFESPIPEVSRPADVVITWGNGRLITECFCVYNDQATSGAMQYDRDLGFRLTMIAESLDIVVSGHWDIRLPAAETEQLLADAQAAAEKVSAEGTPRLVTRPDIELRLAPGPHPPGEILLLEGPDTRSAGWRRASGLIGGKARDWAGAPDPVWLRADLLDGTWLFSEWALQDLPRKTEWMAALLAEAVGDAGTAGVVVSCGQQIGPGAATEDYRGNGGISGMRRRLDALRTREIIIVPLTPGAAGQASLWRNMYDAEPGWMERQLRAASLPGITAIEAGWSVPLPEDTGG